VVNSVVPIICARSLRDKPNGSCCGETRRPPTAVALDPVAEALGRSGDRRRLHQHPQLSGHCEGSFDRAVAQLQFHRRRESCEQRRSTQKRCGTVPCIRMATASWTSPRALRPAVPVACQHQPEHVLAAGTTANFPYTSICNTLAAGRSCRINVSFMPSMTGELMERSPSRTRTQPVRGR
jgi:hypothetical protein